MFPPVWSSARLDVRDSVPEEADALCSLFNACSYAGAWDETFRPEEPEVLAELIGRSMAPGNHFRMQTVRAKGSVEIVGYFHLSFDFPKPKLAWISIVVVDPRHQRKGFGRELVAGLVGQVQALRSYKAIWMKVYLKNWPALRAWISVGFRDIIEYRGEKTFSPDGHASLILARKLGG